jgi:hypothetical protein
LLLLLLPWFGCCQASAGGVQSPCDLVSCLLGPPAPLHLHLDGTHSTLVCGAQHTGTAQHSTARHGTAQVVSPRHWRSAARRVTACM